MNWIPRSAALVIMGVVTTIWVANFVAQFVPALNYTSDPLVHGIFMGIVGGALALTRKHGSPDPPTPPAAPPQVNSGQGSGS